MKRGPILVVVLVIGVMVVAVGGSLIRSSERRASVPPPILRSQSGSGSALPPPLRVGASLPSSGSGSAIPAPLPEAPPKVQLMSLPLTDGMRAVSMPIDFRSSVEGHAQAGSFVDVVLTFVDLEGELGSTILVQGARVLSFGGLTGSYKGSGTNPSRHVNTATLEVSPEDSLKITLAQDLGLVTLMLRNSSDQDPSPSNTESALDLTGFEPKKGCDTGAPRFCPWKPGSRVPMGTRAAPAYCPNDRSPPLLEFSPCAG